MDEVFAMIAVERRRTADVLDGLTEQQWNTESLCAGWRVREVAAHLVMPFSISLPSLILKMIGARCNFDKVADRWAQAHTGTNQELADMLRTHADHRFTPPGFGPEAPLTDVVTHGQDICRPLGIDRGVPADHANVVLGLLMSPKASRGFIPKGLTEGLRFATTDTGWVHGTGLDVTGSGASLILGIGGRRSALDDLTGSGVDTLRSRFAAAAG